MKTIDLARAHAKPGDNVTVWRGSFGQGGIVTVVNDDGISICWADTDYVYDWTQVTRLTTEVPHDADECLEYGPDGADCQGPVEMHWAGGTRSWPRCAHHGELRYQRYENSIEREADSDCAPTWLDPAYAGERWEDD